MIAKEMGATFEYKTHTFQELIPLIGEGKADIAFASVTINEKREETIDFSHPTFNSGLRILLSKSRKNIDFGNTIKTFFTQGYKQFLKPLLVLLLIILVLGSILYFIERSNGSMSVTYFPGILQATWIFLCSMLGLDGALFVYSVSSWAGRLIVSLGQLISLAFLGLFIGELTAFITTKKIRLNIEEPKDLMGKTVATVKQTTSEAVLKDLGAIVVPVVKIEEAYEQLKKNKVEAVVFDAPVLVYYSLNDGVEWAEVTGELFDKQSYGFALPNGSELRKDVNLAILTIQENGSYDQLYKKWFGEN
jgi:polar amino acid transport system substrate-binding protein